MDYIVRATAANSQIRAFAITSREMVETARQHHNTSPVANDLKLLLLQDLYYDSIIIQVL